MMRHIWVLSLVCGILVNASCSEDPAPLTASINYEVCVGLSGRCSSPNCCATKDARLAEGLTSVECEIRRGDSDDLYRIDFEIEGSIAGADFAILGDDVQFYSNADDNRSVVSCNEFMVDENGNEYPTTTCDSVDVRTDPPGGGCEVRMSVDSNSVVQGTFRCKELALPGQTLYLSTVYSSDVGWGEFQIENCDFRL